MTAHIPLKVLVLTTLVTAAMASSRVVAQPRHVTALLAPGPVTQRPAHAATEAARPPVRPLPKAPPREHSCLLHPWCFGPVISLGTIHPLGVGLQIRGDAVGAAVDYQFMPRIGLFDTSARWSMFSVEGRLFPLRGSFFLSLGFAYQTFEARRLQQTAYGRIQATGRLTLPLIKLGLGFVSRSGLTMGIDLGIGIPLLGQDLDFDVATDVPDTVDAEPEYQATLERVLSSIDDAADLAVTLIPFVPQLNLFRIGYQF